MIISRVQPGHVSGQPGKKLVFLWPWDDQGVEIRDIIAHDRTLQPATLFASFKAISINCLNHLDAPCRLSIQARQRVLRGTWWPWIPVDIILAPFAASHGGAAAHITIDRIHQPLESLMIRLQAPIMPTAGQFDISLLGEL